jgi:hypothetical protein
MAKYGIWNSRWKVWIKVCNLQFPKEKAGHLLALPFFYQTLLSFVTGIFPLYFILKKSHLCSLHHCFRQQALMGR